MSKIKKRVITSKSKYVPAVYEDWADRARGQILEVPEVPVQDGTSESYIKAITQRQRREYAIKNNLAVEKERRALREAQVKAHELDVFIGQQPSKEEVKVLHERIAKENAGKPTPEYADTRHLSEDADFYDIDKEGIDLLVSSPNNNDYWYLHDSEEYDIRDEGYEEYLMDHLDPAMKETKEGMERYMRKALTYRLTPYTPEGYAAARAGQFERDERDAISAIDAALEEKRRQERR